MSIIDNTLAAQVPTFDPATPLAKMAQLQAANQEIQQAQFKQNQLELGSEMRGVQPFVNTPEFPAKWREAADRLRQKGVINDQMHEQWANAPSPLLLKSIISQTDSPEMAFRKDESVRTQKNTDREFGLANRRLALAEDPTPDGFEKNPDFGKVEGAPQYRPMSGGPQSPEYLTSVAKAKGDVPTIIGQGSSVIIPNKAQEGAIFTNKPQSDTALDEDTTDLLARRTLQGDTRALIGLGRGAQGGENILKIQKRVAELAKAEGIDATDILNNVAVQAGRTAEARTLGTKSAHFGTAEKAMEESLPIALEASKNVPRTQWRAMTELIQKGQTQINDPQLKKFLIATDTAAKDYARTINPSGQTRESDIAYARKLISTADSPEAYEAALSQLKVEAGVTKRAIQRQKDELRSQGKSEKEHGKVAAPDRFKQIMKENGGDKTAAYATMQAEGY
jgi:hypothetical protein